jgi:hypothetical protein
VKSRRFVEAFVRPFGLDVAGVDGFVAAIESMEGEIPAPSSRIAAAMVRPLLAAWKWHVARGGAPKRRRKATREQSSERPA